MHANVVQGIVSLWREGPEDACSVSGFFVSRAQSLSILGMAAFLDSLCPYTRELKCGSKHSTKVHKLSSPAAYRRSRRKKGLERS
jgi:hypothetical protein